MWLCKEVALGVHTKIIFMIAEVDEMYPVLYCETASSEKCKS
jgi:hypothetical protein